MTLKTTVLDYTGFGRFFLTLGTERFLILCSLFFISKNNIKGDYLNLNTFEKANLRHNGICFFCITCLTKFFSF